MITFVKELRKAYYGAKSIASIYVGDTLVWPIDRPPASTLFIGGVLRFIHSLPIGKLTGDVASKIDDTLFKVDDSDRIVIKE